MPQTEIVFPVGEGNVFEYGESVVVHFSRGRRKIYLLAPRPALDALSVQ